MEVRGRRPGAHHLHGASHGQVGHPSWEKRIIKTFQRSTEVRGRHQRGGTSGPVGARRAPHRPCTPPPGPLSTGPETSRAPAPSQVTGHVKKKKEFQKLFRDPWRSGAASPAGSALHPPPGWVPPARPPSRDESVTVKEKRVFKKFFRVSWRSGDGSPAGLRPCTPPPGPLSTKPPQVPRLLERR